MTDHDVLIVGAGPTGLMLAAELRLQGVEPLVVERRATPERVGPGALGLHARTLEVFEQRGIADRFLGAGTPAQVLGFAGARFDISGWPSRHPRGLALAQRETERIMLRWAEEFGVAIERGVEVTGIEPADDGVEVRVDGGRAIRARYVVGCDGGRSTIRKAVGIGFPGSDPTISHLLAEVRLTEPPELGLRKDAIGTHAMSPAPDGKVGIIVTERGVGTAEPTLAILREALRAHYGTDFGVHDPTWITRFTDMTRHADAYRAGRVLLAGDAAHIHYPAGGFGLNLGVQDAVNLGWKLAQVVRGTSPDDLLDTYHAERHPVAASLIRYPMATVALGRSDERSVALAEIVGELVAVDGAWQPIAGEMSGLAIRYDLGEGHPLLGRAMPDLELATADGPTRVSTLLHEARPLLLRFDDAGAADAAIDGWTDRVQVVDATTDRPWQLPVSGVVPAPNAVLVRPDGHAAWVGEGSDDGLEDALTRWFGDPVRT